MGALVTVMVSQHLADGCAVAKDAVAALVEDGWTPPKTVQPSRRDWQEKLLWIDKLHQ